MFRYIINKEHCQEKDCINIQGIVFLILFLIFVLSGCSSVKKTIKVFEESAPEIENVQTGKVVDGVYYATSSFKVGDKCSLRVTVIDDDLDIKTMYLRLYYPKDSTTPYIRLKPIELKPQTKRMTSVYLDRPMDIDGPDGEWRMDVRIEDEKHNMSSVYKIFAIVHY